MRSATATTRQSSTPVARSPRCERRITTSTAITTCSSRCSKDEQAAYNHGTNCEQVAPPRRSRFLFIFFPRTILHFTNSLQTTKRRTFTGSAKLIHIEDRDHHHNQGNKMNLLKTQREALLEPLQAVTGIIERRHTLPILSNVLLSRTDTHIEFVATDIEIEITTSMTLEGPGDAKKLTVGARKLVDILRALPEGSEVTLALQDKRLQVKSGKSRFNLQTLSAADLPRLLR